MLPTITFMPKIYRSMSRLPLASIVIEREKYISVYDPRNKIPVYVYERLSRNSLKGKASRRGVSFSEDISLPFPMRAKPLDYKNSGFSRAHMCRAAHCKKSLKVMRESFLMTNVCPKIQALNQGHWLRLENWVLRELKSHDFIESFSGGAFLPEVCQDGKRRVSYEVIGESNVAVPTHFFKSLYFHKSGSITNRAFLFPNRRFLKDVSLQSFETTVDHIEKVTGLIFGAEALFYPINYEDREESEE